jgi:HlyD family secretion protein
MYQDLKVSAHRSTVTGIENMNDPMNRRFETASVAEANGDTLTERVRGLRLPSRIDQAGSGPQGSWLPWIVCLMLAACCASLLVRGWSTPAVSTRTRTLSPADSSKTDSNAVQTKDGAVPSKSVGSSNRGPDTSGGIALVVQGFIIPVRTVSVSPIEVGGRIVDLDEERFVEGQIYQEGEVLAVIDSTSFKAELDEAISGLKAAQARLAEAKNGFRKQERDQAEAELREARVNLQQLELEYNRNKALYASRSVSISKQEFEKIEAALDAQRYRVERLKANLDLILEGTRYERIEAAIAEEAQAQARLARAKWRLDNCTIRAPITGTILSRKAEKGDLVNPLAFNATSGSLCTMADLSELEVTAEVQERDVSKVFKGQRCTITTESYGDDRVYQGVVSRLMPIANRAKGTIEVRVRIDGLLNEQQQLIPLKQEAGQYLKPEMRARVTFLKELAKQS